MSFEVALEFESHPVTKQNLSNRAVFYVSKKLANLCSIHYNTQYLLMNHESYTNVAHDIFYMYFFSIVIETRTVLCALKNLLIMVATYVLLAKCIIGIYIYSPTYFMSSTFCSFSKY